MQAIIVVNKPVGISPLDAIQVFKKHHPEYAQEVISYAGRLDPMAGGLLLLLVGQENKRRHEYEGWQKKYTFTVLLGASTDTYDMLGKVTLPDSSLPLTDHLPDVHQVQTLLPTFIGTRLQSYPPYSSRTVNGKPLYWWARNNRLAEITIPQKEIRIDELNLKDYSTITGRDLHHVLREAIKKVNGNFRQTDILQTWNEFFKPVQYTGILDKTFPVLSCTVTCSSGTYVRGIANELGQLLGCGAFALSITRTQIGNYSLGDAIPLIPASPETR